MSQRWLPLPVPALAERLLDLGQAGGPVIVAVNGYSSSGKTSLARRLQVALPSSAVVHTDDVAWYHSVLDWDDLLVSGILAPVRRGEPVSFRPPAWVRLERPGSITVPVGIDVLIIEGVGSARRSLAEEYDFHIWVDCYTSVRGCRNAIRVAAGEMGFRDFEQWMAEETQHMLTDRPWERADLTVAGDGRLRVDEHEILVAALS